MAERPCSRISQKASGVASTRLKAGRTRSSSRGRPAQARPRTPGRWPWKSAAVHGGGGELSGKGPDRGGARWHRFRAADISRRCARRARWFEATQGSAAVWSAVFRRARASTRRHVGSATVSTSRPMSWSRRHEIAFPASSPTRSARARAAGPRPRHGARIRPGQQVGAGRLVENGCVEHGARGHGRDFAQTDEGYGQGHGFHLGRRVCKGAVGRRRT